MGSLQIGILMMLNNDIDTKAFSTSRIFSGDTSKYVVKVARATWRVRETITASENNGIITLGPLVIEIPVDKRWY